MPRAAALAAIFWLCVSQGLLAQRRLGWDALDVDARLDAGGVLHVTETQAIVFSGDWNGGERTFNLRPRQSLQFVGMECIDSASRERIALNSDFSLDDKDEYWFTQPDRVRWRSRLASDPAFSNARITYVLHYQLSNILLKEDDQYVLDHDFAFPDRIGNIARFSLRLTLDPEWQALSRIDGQYAAGPLPPGESFVLRIPMRYTGAALPLAQDGRQPPAVVAAVSTVLGAFGLALLWFFMRENRLGRFAPVRDDRVDSNWIGANIIAHPAEVVGAAWDGSVGSDEVVALIARMVSEDKLASEVKGQSMSLQLKADRKALQGHERALVDALFFDGRTTTSTAEVKSHYREKGFEPATVIAADLQARVEELLPKGTNPRVWWWPSAGLFLAGVGCLVMEAVTTGASSAAPLVVAFGAMIAGGVGQIPGLLFRSRIDWGLRAVFFSLIPAVLVAGGVATFLWFWVGPAWVELSPWMLGAVAALTTWIVYTSINGLKSRNHRDAIALRKKLAAGRLYFFAELAKSRPDLRDEWYPWIAAFGLSKEADEWSVRNSLDKPGEQSRWEPSRTSSSTSSSASSESAWTGGGGRSGGAGATAAWSAAAAGLAADVAPPSSSSSGGEHSSSSSSSGSGGSSGGGGGGGW